MTRAVLHSAAVAVLLLLAAPLAAAQGDAATQTKTTVSIASLDGPVANGTEATTPVEVTYCTQPQSASDSPTTVEVRVNRSPAWSEGSVSPSTLEFPVSPTEGGTDGQQCSTRTTNLTVAVASTAPGGVAGDVEVLAQAQENGPLVAASQGTDTTTVEVAGSSAAGQGNATGTVNATGSAGSQGGEAGGGNGVPGLQAPLVTLAIVGVAVLVRRYDGRVGHT